MATFAGVLPAAPQLVGVPISPAAGGYSAHQGVAPLPAPAVGLEVAPAAGGYTIHTGVIDAPVQSPQDVVPTGIPSGEAFGSPTIEIEPDIVVIPSPIPSGEAFGSPTVVIVPDPPFIFDEDPAPGATNVPVTSPIKFKLDDNLQGVDLSTVQITIRYGSGPEQTVFNGGLFIGAFSGSVVPFGATGFAFEFSDAVPLPASTVITVGVFAQDFVGDTLDTAYAFNTIILVGSLEEEPFLLDMYRFILFEIRRQDILGTEGRLGNEFLRRYLAGPNELWKTRIVRNIQRIPSLWDVENIDANKLQFLKTIVGWTQEGLLKKITDAIDDESLRRLIAVSGRLWKARGPEDTILDVLRVLSPARSRIWNWFDFRWVLEETELGEEHEGRDPWVVHLPASVGAELTVDTSGITNTASGDGTSATTLLGVSAAVKSGDVFALRSGAQNGAEATVLGVAGSVISFVQGPSNGITQAFNGAQWEIIDRKFEPDDDRRSNLRIVDDGALDRDLVKRVLRLMRPAGERFDITYLAFLDRFLVDGDDLQWAPLGADAISGGKLRLTNTAQAESAHVIVPDSDSWAEYVYTARLRGASTSAGDLFGVSFYRTTASRYEVMIDTAQQQLILRSVIGVTTTVIATADLNALGFPMLADVFYAIRVSVVLEGAANRIQVFVDGFQLLSVTDAAIAQGAVGFVHTAGARLEADEAEVILLPADTDTLEINAEP